MQTFDSAELDYISNLCERTEDFYPTSLLCISGRDHNTSMTFGGNGCNAVYGYVYGGAASVATAKGSHQLSDGGCFVANDKALKVQALESTTRVFCFIRYGYRPLEMFSAIEHVGRLSYIDGCSDTVLIPPPRAGDACLNHLHFPEGILQTQHIHPTVRIGLVVRGEGKAFCSDPGNSWSIDLKPGVAFVLVPQERHSFRTDLDGSSMDIIAFHPDSNTGPTDDNHPMINRTYIRHGGGK